MRTNLTTQKTCAEAAIANMEGQRSLGNVAMKDFMLVHHNFKS